MVSVTPAAPLVVSMTLEVLPLASPPPAAAPTLSRSSSVLVSPPPEPVVLRVRIKKRKATERIEGAAKRTKSVKILVINLDVYEKLKEMEEEVGGPCLYLHAVGPGNFWSACQMLTETGGRGEGFRYVWFPSAAAFGM